MPKITVVIDQSDDEKAYIKHEIKTDFTPCETIGHIELFLHRYKDKSIIHVETDKKE